MTSISFFKSEMRISSLHIESDGIQELGKNRDCDRMLRCGYAAAPPFFAAGGGAATYVNTCVHTKFEANRRARGHYPTFHDHVFGCVASVVRSNVQMVAGSTGR